MVQTSLLCVTAVNKAYKIIAILSCVAIVVVGVSLFCVYQASQLVPAFYADALALDPAEQVEDRDAFVAQATALASDLHRRGRWQCLFTEEQINAWLALELSKSYPELLTSVLSEPRITLADNEATIACRYTTDEVSAIVSLTIDVYMHEPGVLALRIRRARAGLLPVPLGQILDGMASAAHQLGVRLEWTKTHGDPVALMTFPAASDDPDGKFQLHAVELRPGKLFAAGMIAAGRSIVNSGSTPGAAVSSSDASQTNANESDQPVVGSAEKESLQR